MIVVDTFEQARATALAAGIETEPYGSEDSGAYRVMKFGPVMDGDSPILVDKATGELTFLYVPELIAYLPRVNAMTPVVGRPE